MTAELFVAGRSTDVTAEVRAPWDDALIDAVAIAEDAQIERAISTAELADGEVAAIVAHARAARDALGRR